MGYIGVTMPARKPAKVLLVALLALAIPALGACGGAADADSPAGEDRPFSELKKEARGTEVNLAMYGGDEAINSYVDDYVIPELEKENGIRLRRTPLGDTADAVIWFGPWAKGLPNAEFVDWESPSINRDFGQPVEGREAPWGRAQFVMIHDSDKVEDPPRTMDELRAWVEENPGRFAYPAPPDFTGNAFVEQAFYDVTGKVDAYQKPFDGEVFYGESPKLYDFLRDIEPNLWRGGETYPKTSAKLDELYANGEVWLTMSYNSQLAQRQVDKGLWPGSTRSYVLDGGTLNNTHYLAIPFDGPNKAGAQVVTNFLESPEAQAEKQDPEGWGDLTALSLDRLPEDARKEFAEPEGEASLPTRVLQQNRVPEARTEWLLKLEEGWQEEVLED